MHIYRHDLFKVVLSDVDVRNSLIWWGTRKKAVVFDVHNAAYSKRMGHAFDKLYIYGSYFLFDVCSLIYLSKKSDSLTN